MKRFRRILIPVDFSACSRQALEHGLSLAHTYRASVEVIHCWVPSYPPSWMFMSSAATTPASAAMETEAEHDAKRSVETFLAGISPPAGVEIQASAEMGHPADVIVQMSPHYDLIVMGTHGRTGLSKVFLGSVATKVIARAACPVLTVREEKARRSLREDTTEPRGPAA